MLVGETEKGPTKYPVSAVVGAIKAIMGGGEVEVNRKHIKNISLRLGRTCGREWKRQPRCGRTEMECP